MFARSSFYLNEQSRTPFWQSPSLVLAVLCAYQLVVWSLAPLVLDRGLHVNILQVALWGREWLMVSYKHPNLPGWAFEGAEEMFGYSALLAYVLAQIFVTATIVFVYLTARDLLEDRWLAVAATAVVPSLFYFSVPSILFNHNIAQMPFWVAFIWLFNRALTRDSMGYWLLAAAVAALAMYVKLSTLLLVGLAFLWLLIDQRGRAALRHPRPWLGIAVFIIGLIPLLLALKESGFQPITYASDRATNPAHPLLLVSATAVILASPIAAMWLAGGVAFRDIPALLWQRAMPSRQYLLLWFVLFPIAMCAVAAFVADIRVLWLTPMFSLWGVYLVGNLPRRWQPAQAWRLAGVAIAANLVMLFVYGTYYFIGNLHSARPLRWEDWPQREIASALEARWRDATGGAPLRIVGGPLHFAGAVAFWANDEPSLYENLDPAESPWVTPQRIARQGMLVVWEPGDLGNAVLAPWLARYPTGTLTLTWSHSAAARPMTLDYLVVPPQQKDTHAVDE
jgi:hypothetical protein